MTMLVNLPTQRSHYFSAAMASFAIVVILFWLMQSLISHADKSLEPSKTTSFLDFVRVKPVKRTSELQKPKPPKVTPKTPDLPPLTEEKLSFDNASPVNLNIQPTLNLEPAKYVLSASAGDYSPLVQIAPIYPHNARRRGIEGHCVVQFDVNTQGITKNIKIVDCDSHFFHKSSISAVSKFRYHPRVVDGKPVEVKDVKTRFNYRLEKD